MITLDILLVTYNQEQYIQQALDGILMQRVNPDVNLRIIIADDYSTDKTLSCVKNTFGQKIKLASGNESEVVYLPTDHNLGHVRNYQHAFAACTGDYAAIIEGDDYWCNPLHIQTHIDFLETHKECVLSSQRPVWYYEKEKRFDTSSILNSKDTGWVYVTIEEEIQANRIENLSSCVIRISALHKLERSIFKCSVLDWPMYVNLSQMGLLCILSGSSNVYRAKSSGLYAGLNKDAEVRMDLLVLNEMEDIFPQYSLYYENARRLIVPPKKSNRRRIMEIIIWPWAKLGKIFHQIGVIYREMKK